MNKPFCFHLTQQRQKQVELLGKGAGCQQTNGLKDVIRNRNGNSNQGKKSNVIPIPDLFFPDVGLVIERYRQEKKQDSWRQQLKISLRSI